MHQVAEQNSGTTCQSSAAANSKAAPSLPPWALAASASTKHLSQPWKARYGSEPDDPNFTAEKDTVVYFDSRIKVCYSEGTMAA
ncbi:hypothetical protein CKAH01_10135 [Colletotrichum kahawae]|uniref:Uncharacterized protein n=1 Tax=Colletotrichum kahawae TaxID=34407 RepID=A0AAE0CXF4_COLKA|nr:hypothetical protein CKAH01_10135 [Colletotrichum kahawae]